MSVADWEALVIQLSVSSQVYLPITSNVFEASMIATNFKESQNMSSSRKCRNDEQDGFSQHMQ